MSYPQETDVRDEVEALCREALAASATEPARARALVDRALGLARATGEPRVVAGALYALGIVRLAQADCAGAEADLHLALERSRSAGDEELTIDILRGLLKCAIFTQRPDVALTRGMQALNLAERRGDGARRAAVHNEVGLIYGRLGDYEGSIDHLLAGLRLLREAGEGEDGSVLNNIGNVYLELRDDRQALGFFRAALEVFMERGTARQQGIALGNIGRANTRLGEHRAALEALRRSVETFEAVGDRLYLAPALARLGAAYGALEELAAARTCFGRALSIAEEAEPREFLDEVLVAAGTFHLQRGEIALAVDLLRRALAIIPADETTPRLRELHRTLAEAYEQAGDLPAALHHLKAYQRVGQAVTDATTLVRIRKLMVEFDVERARQQEEIFRLKNVELARANEELRVLHGQLEAQNRELQRLTLEDPLTGLFNRRYLDLQLPSELSRARRRGRSLSVAMCDIDHFKVINDRFSHAVGDEVLRQLGRLFRTVLRQEDLICRYGGEEFLIVMPETDLAGASGLVERLRARLAEHSWTRIHPELRRVTLSVGLVEAEAASDAEALLAEADARLYRAKHGGRNRVVRGGGPRV